MDEYIKRSDALKVIETANSMASSFLEASMKLCVTMDRISAADVVPVRHGRWEWNEENLWHRCSACGMTFDYDKTYELFDHGFQLASYCPNCGARTDGDGDGTIN